jgi:hypothetical protein
MDSIILGDLAATLKYGPIYLNAEELQAQLKCVLDRYYHHLARGVVSLRGVEYWKYHRDGLNALGLRINPSRLACEVCRKILTSFLHPVNSAKAALEWWPGIFKAIRKQEPKARIRPQVFQLPDRKPH